MSKKDILKQSLSKLNPQEQQEYIKLNKIFSQPLNEVNEGGIQKGIKYLTKNWKNYSLAMLTALMLNPNISNAMNNYSPETFNAIQTELSQGDIKEKDGVKTVDFSQTFESGKSNVNREQLQSKLSEIQQFMKGKKAGKYGVRVIASESQVTNPYGYGKGELSQERANNVKTILSKLGFGNIETINQIGETPYQKGKDNPQDKRYTDEQFVRVEIFVNTENICSLNQDINDKTGQGSISSDFITVDKELAGEGKIRFSTGTIPDRLVVLDDSGNISYDTGYITTKPSIYKDWKYVPLYVAQLTKLDKDNVKALSSNKLKVIKANDLNSLIKQLLNNPNNTTYQKLGAEIAPGLEQLKQMIESGVTEFVIYDVSSGDVSIPFSENKGDTTLQVYSPLGSTGLTVKGDCQR
jgi:flagellar motor protein MotB